MLYDFSKKQEKNNLFCTLTEKRLKGTMAYRNPFRNNEKRRIHEFF